MKDFELSSPTRTTPNFTDQLIKALERRYLTGSTDQVLRTLVERANGGAGGRVLTVNTQILRLLARGDVSSLESDVYTADGWPVVVLRWLLGHSPTDKVAGSDLLMAAAADVRATRLGISFIILGAAGQEAATVLGAMNPGLELTGEDLPFLDAEDPELAAHCLRSVPADRGSLTFLCLGAPKQETVAAVVTQARPCAVVVGAGASAGMLAGSVRQAPLLLRRLHLEWLWRLVNEPRRLSRRYLAQDLPFLLCAVWAVLKYRLST